MQLGFYCIIDFVYEVIEKSDKVGDKAFEVFFLHLQRKKSTRTKY